MKLNFPVVNSRSRVTGVTPSSGDKLLGGKRQSPQLRRCFVARPPSHYGKSVGAMGRINGTAGGCVVLPASSGVPYRCPGDIHLQSLARADVQGCRWVSRGRDATLMVQINSCKISTVRVSFVITWPAASFYSCLYGLVSGRTTRKEIRGKITRAL